MKTKTQKKTEKSKHKNREQVRIAVESGVVAECTRRDHFECYVNLQAVFMMDNFIRQAVLFFLSVHICLFLLSVSVFMTNKRVHWISPHCWTT